jgi:hypothetical protein
MPMVELECKNVVFYSAQDEAAFFTWARAIPPVAGVADGEVGPCP